MSKQQKTSPPLGNLVLTFLAATASVATLAPEDRDPSGSSWTHIEWKGQSQSFNLTINPVDRRLESFEYNGAHHLDLDLSNVLEKHTNRIRWMLTMNQDSEEAFTRSGGVTFDHYNGQEDRRGAYGNVMARMGSLCTENDDSTNDCIPCLIEEGCSLTIQIDLCYMPNSDRRIFNVGVTQTDGAEYRLVCPEKSDPEPCELLDEWLIIGRSSSTVSLCIDE